MSQSYKRLSLDALLLTLGGFAIEELPIWPPLWDEVTLEHVKELRAQRLSWDTIAQRLNRSMNATEVAYCRYLKRQRDRPPVPIRLQRPFSSGAQ